MLQPSPTITVLCSTINRPSLRALIRSWEKQDLVDGDRLWLYGDGVEKPAWMKNHPRVEYMRRPKAGHWGHKHLVEGMNKVETTHYTFMGDDDVYLSWAFRDMRKALCDVPVLTSVMNINGEILSHLRGEVSDRVCIGGWQMWIPSGIKLMDFTNASDAEAWRDYKERGGPHKDRFDLAPVAFKGGLWV